MEVEQGQRRGEWRPLLSSFSRAVREERDGELGDARWGPWMGFASMCGWRAFHAAVQWQIGWIWTGGGQLSAGGGATLTLPSLSTATAAEDSLRTGRRISLPLPPTEQRGLAPFFQAASEGKVLRREEGRRRSWSPGSRIL